VGKEENKKFNFETQRTKEDLSLSFSRAPFLFEEKEEETNVSLSLFPSKR